MKRILIALAALLVLGGGSALAASASFNVNITIRQAIVIAKQTDLNFGTVETGSATYTVLAAASAGSGAGAGATSAWFKVTGESGQSATVSFTSNPVTVDCTPTCGTPLSVTLTLDSVLGSTLPFTAGPDNYYVGGSVDVTGANAGVYSGAATLQVIYN
jgi:Domain of unknown function (DUF4402)